MLWRVAPHVVWPLRFVLPHHKGLRPAWLLRLGLFLYDHLGGRDKLPATRSLDLRSDPAGKPLKPGDFTKAFEYSDCWVDDARLVVLNAVDAARRGADIRTRTRAVSAERRGDHWFLTTEHVESGQREQIQARTLVNAAGPWVARTLSDVAKVETKARIRLVQGSHIVVPKLFDHDRCYIFQNTDGRIVFAIPVRAGLHADRHHRPGLPGRARRHPHQRGGDRLSVQPRQRLFRAADRAQGRGVELFRRAPAL